MTDIEKNPSLQPEPEETPEDTRADDALERFLSRDNKQEKSDKPAKPRRLDRRVLVLIIAILIVGALIALFFFLRGLPGAEGSEESFTPAEIQETVDASGEHRVIVPTDNSGAVAENGSGTLLSYTPADLERIEVENQSGSFTIIATTPEGGSTAYTLVGYERYELQSGMPQDVANDAASLDFTQIVSAKGELSDFGLSSPRATVSIRYTDNSAATVRVGDPAPAGAGTYIAFGDSDAVYLVADDAVDAFLYDVLSLISLKITQTGADTDADTFSSLTITGSRYPKAITLAPNTDEAVKAAYKVTSPRKMFANATESFDIAGSVRGLYAESVVCVDPTDAQLSSYGLSSPYAAVEAAYPDTTVRLSASAPGDDGTVYLYNPDTDVVYTIQLGAISWAKTGLDALIPETFLDVDLKYVSAIQFSAGGKRYAIDVETTTQQVDTTEGETEEVTTTTATYDGERLGTDNFSVFFQNLMGIQYTGPADSEGRVVMEVRLRYTNGRADDVLTAYDNGGSGYAIALGGELFGMASKSYVNKLITCADDLISGRNVTGF